MRNRKDDREPREPATPAQDRHAGRLGGSVGPPVSVGPL